MILEKLDELRLTMKEVSLSIGRNPTYLQQFLKRGVPAELDERDRINLANALGVDENALRGPSPILGKREYIKVNPTVPQSTVADRGTAHTLQSHMQSPTNYVPGHQLTGDMDLPVFGLAEGGSGALILTNQAVDYVTRPDPLLRVRDGYGIIVTGDSMSPAHRSGSTALVNPHLPPRNGDICIFRSHKDDGTVYIIIKELRRFTDDTWYVRQYEPAKDFTLKRTEWQECHVTVGNYFAR